MAARASSGYVPSPSALTYGEAAAIFRRAAANLRESGWIQRTNGGPTQGYCAAGALRNACSESSHFLPVYYLTMDRLLGHWVEGWNDQPGRTGEEVIRLLDDFADDLELSGQITSAAAEATDGPPAFDHQPDAGRLAKDARVLERVADDGEEVRRIGRLDGADLFQAERVRGSGGRRL